MDAAVLLCDSTICRLCAEENENGTFIFPTDEHTENLSELVNKYLPLKVEKDGKYPCTLCPGCTIQIEATKIFFDLIIEGQLKLRDLLSSQQIVLRRQEKQKEQLENALKIVNPNSSLQSYSVQNDADGEKIFIQILSEGPLFPPDHEMSLRTDGLDKPKRKRGRPAKALQVETAPVKNVEAVREQEKDIVEYDADGRRKRRIKKPQRYSELLQGKELDRVFKEVGVLDDEEQPSDTVQLIKRAKPDLGTDTNDSDEIIGHMQGENGEELGQLVINKNGNKVRTKHKNGTVLSKKQFQCEFCERMFFHKSRLDLHMSFHKDIKYECGGTGCSQSYETKTALEGHQKTTGHSGTKFIECLENYGQIELTQKSKSTPNGIIERAFSQGIEPSIDILSGSEDVDVDKFMNTDSEKEKSDQKQPDKIISSVKNGDRNYACESCGKVFNHPSSLVYHREAEHNARKFVCVKCNKTFKHKQLLLRHQKVHTNERPHVCKCCGSTFKTKANLLNHMPTHTGEKKYYCTQCGQTFAHKTSLTLHVRWHNGQKPYECDICMKTFSQKGNLAEHRRIHTGEKPYTCTYCSRKFTTSSQYKLHIKRHTGERPWRCEYCSKTFLHKDTWKCHTRRHRNERPYQCQMCLRGFTEQWALRKHERLHTGEKPYVCNICSKSFADSSNLKKHKQIHLSGKKNLKFENESLNDLRSVDICGDLPATSQTEGSNQIVYLTYQDGNSNEDQTQTLVHIVDAMNDDQTTNKIQDDIFTNTDMLENEEIEMDVHLQQIVDNDGNAISFTTADGLQMKVVSTTGDDQSIQGLMPDGTLVPINLTMQDGKPVAAEMIRNDIQDFKQPAELLQPNIQLLVGGEQAEDDDNKIQLLNTNANPKMQFLTQDGQNMCFITTYIDNNTFNSNSQYLNMP